MWHANMSADQAPYRVLLKRGELIDGGRSNEDGSPRAVPFKLYYPSPDDLSAGEKIPLILWSHGYGGSRDGAAFLARYLASHGYALAHLTHIGTDSSLWEGKGGHPWEVLQSLTISRATTLNRYRDPSFVLDQMPAWIDSAFKGALPIDWNRIGMSGHSFGAITTQVMSGQLTPDHEGALIDLHDPRVKASISYSPVPGTSHLSNDTLEAKDHDVYGSIKTPMLHMTGTQDASPVNNMPYQDRLQVFDGTKLAPKALLIKEQGDHMVYNGTRGALAANPLRERHEDMIQIMSLAWWNAWLKDEAAAKKWLQEGRGSAKYLGADAQWRYESL